MQTFKYSCEFIGKDEEKQIVEFEGPIDFTITETQSYSGKKISFTEYLDNTNDGKLNYLYHQLPLDTININFYIFIENEKIFLYNVSNINELNCETKFNTNFIENESLIDFWGKNYNFYTVLDIK